MLVPTNIGGRDQADQQMELFLANCLIRGRWVEFVIDNGSSANLVAQCLVWDLQLHTKLMVQPYELSWMADFPEVIICE